MFIPIGDCFKDRNIDLVLGVNGQDGSYLAEELISRGHFVIGIARQKESRWVKKNSNFVYHQLDLENLKEYIAYLCYVKPSFIYHLAAVHGPAGFDYEANWISVHTINTLVVQASLEYLKKSNPGGRLIYASSSKVFDFPINNLIDENTKRKSSCIYSITKNSATELIHYYREKYGIKSNIFWLFNHESPRRSTSYFIPKVVDILKKSLQDTTFTAEFGDLDFWCDWGDASEYMKIIIDVVETKVSEDFILGSGQVINANEYIGKLFLLYELNAAKYIKDWQDINNKELDPPWGLNLSKISNAIGRIPQKNIYEISSEILEMRRFYDDNKN